MHDAGDDPFRWTSLCSGLGEVATRRRALQALTFAAAWPAPAASVAAAIEVDLLLVLAVDASGSVNMHRFELQQQGYAKAFRHPLVLRAIATGPTRSIAVTMTQWTGPLMQVHALPWTRIHDLVSAEAFARAIAIMPRQLFSGGTSISGAIDHAAGLLKAPPFTAERRVIDVSGDGANNRGRPASVARDEAVAHGLAINGLPILALEPHLDAYYLDNVIGGPGAFMVAAADYETFADAILKKLILEIAATSVDGSALGVASEQPASRSHAKRSRL